MRSTVGPRPAGLPEPPSIMGPKLAGLSLPGAVTALACGRVSHSATQHQQAPADHDVHQQSYESGPGADASRKLLFAAGGADLLAYDLVVGRVVARVDVGRLVWGHCWAGGRGTTGVAGGGGRQRTTGVAGDGGRTEHTGQQTGPGEQAAGAAVSERQSVEHSPAQAGDFSIDPAFLEAEHPPTGDEDRSWDDVGDAHHAGDDRDDHSNAPPPTTNPAHLNLQITKLLLLNENLLNENEEILVEEKKLSERLLVVGTNIGVVVVFRFLRVFPTVLLSAGGASSEGASSGASSEGRFELLTPPFGLEAGLKERSFAALALLATDTPAGRSALVVRDIVACPAAEGSGVWKLFLAKRDGVQVWRLCGRPPPAALEQAGGPHPASGLANPFLEEAVFVEGPSLLRTHPVTTAHSSIPTQSFGSSLSSVLASAGLGRSAGANCCRALALRRATGELVVGLDDGLVVVLDIMPTVAGGSAPSRTGQENNLPPTRPPSGHCSALFRAHGSAITKLQFSGDFLLTGCKAEEGMKVWGCPSGEGGGAGRSVEEQVGWCPSGEGGGAGRSVEEQVGG